MITQCNTPEETHALGVRVGELVESGMTIALYGDLGAGKTVFAKGIGQGLGVTSQVTSPSYIVVQSHTGGRLEFWHADLYRLDSVADLEQLGIDEIAQTEGVIAVEWPDKFCDELSSDRLEVIIKDDVQGRDIEFKATGERSGHLLDKLFQQ